MFAHRGLFLAATVLSTNVVLADILIRPSTHQQPTQLAVSRDLQHQYYNDPHNSQSRPQYFLSQNHAMLPTQQYYGKSLTSQQSLPYPVRTVSPYSGLYQDQARSPSMGSPLLQPWHSFSSFHPPYTPFRIRGSDKFVRPGSMFYPHFSTVQRIKRSNPTIQGTSKPAGIRQDDVVATKSSLTNKNLTAIDSYLPENEPIDTNDKHVKSRQSTKDYYTRGPLLFGLYPENMHGSEHQQQRNIKIKFPVSTNIPVSTTKQPDAQSTVNPALSTVTEPTRQIIPASSQEEGQDQKKIHTDYNDPLDDYSILLDDSMKFVTPTLVSSGKASDKTSASRVASHDYESMYKNAYKRPDSYQSTQTSLNWLNNLYPAYEPQPHNFPDPVDLSYVLKIERERNLQNQKTDKNFLQESHGKYNEEPSEAGKLLGTPNPNDINEPYGLLVPYEYSNYYVSPSQTYVMYDDSCDYDHPWRYYEPRNYFWLYV